MRDEEVIAAADERGIAMCSPAFVIFLIVEHSGLRSRTATSRHFVPTLRYSQSPRRTGPRALFAESPRLPPRLGTIQCRGCVAAAVPT